MIIVRTASNIDELLRKVEEAVAQSTGPEHFVAVIIMFDIDYVEYVKLLAFLDGLDVNATTYRYLNREWFDVAVSKTRAVVA